MECRGDVVISWSSGTRSSMGPNLGFGRKFQEKSSFDTHNTPTTGVKARWHVSNQSWWVTSMELWGLLVAAYLYWAPYGGQACASTDKWLRNNLSGSSRHIHHNSP